MAAQWIDELRRNSTECYIGEVKVLLNDRGRRLVVVLKCISTTRDPATKSIQNGSFVRCGPRSALHSSPGVL